jgi:hypothetical protein
MALSVLAAAVRAAVFSLQYNFVSNLYFKPKARLNLAKTDSFYSCISEVQEATMSE